MMEKKILGLTLSFLIIGLVNYSFAKTPEILVEDIKNNDIAEVTKAIENGADVNAILDDRGNTALLYAIGYNSLEITKLLIKAGANINYKDINGMTPLMWSRSLDIAKLLIDSGADVNERDNAGQTVLIISALTGELLLDKTNLLINNGADINARTNDGITVLMAACNARKPSIELIKLLINKGIDVNAKEKKEGGTALIFAISSGSLEVTKLLIDNGADVNIKSIRGETPLSFAQEQRYNEIVTLLKERGAK
jgi:ankyrin repeat protein